MMNKVILIGNVADVKKFDSMVTINMATNEVLKDKDGNKQTHTEWWNVKTFGKLSEVVDNYIKKGDLIYIEGRQRTETSNGKEYRNIYADTIKMLGKKSDNSAPEPKPEPKQEAPIEAPKSFQPSDDLPFILFLPLVIGSLLNILV